MYSQKTILHISSKFNSEIDKIAQTMLESATKTKLGRELVEEHHKLRGTAKLTASMKGDLALISINQEMVELEQLAQMMKTHDTEADFNTYENELLFQIMKLKN